MKETRYYILFPNHTEGIKLEALFRKTHIKYTIVPTPRELSSSCGIAMMYNLEDEEKIEELIKENDIKISGKQSLTKVTRNYYLD